MAYYYGVNNNKTQVDYTAYGTGYQVCLPMDTEINIPKDDPVRLLSAIIERMNLEALFATYCENGRIEYDPRRLLKICIYGYIRHIISSRNLEQACQENTKFMYLLEGAAAPDHNTIARFRSRHLAACQEQIQQELVRVLMEWGEISFEQSAVFIDGTKIESVGNRYQFVWKKSVEKNYQKLQATMAEKLPGMLKSVGLRFYVSGEIKVKQLKGIRKRLYARMKQDGIEKVSGKGTRKSNAQKVLEQIEEWMRRITEYLRKIRICGDRSSYCKTDTEATFMRLKEDHMCNGQLKPAYNVNVATVSEYIVGTYVSADRTDTKTTIPFMEKLRSAYPVQRVVYDSGYESEEAYRYFEEHPQIDLYIKPANYEQKKHKKYKTDISRRENMAYDPEADAYTCSQGKLLHKTGVRNIRTSTGYVSEKTVYECADCAGCPCKEKCIRSKSKAPLEERSKRLEVSRYFAAQRQTMEQKISTEEGKTLRMNRSIQAEGVFAYTKTDLQFRRFMLRGKEKVGAEWSLLAMAYNILRMHHKAQNERLGTHLFAMKKT